VGIFAPAYGYIEKNGVHGSMSLTDLEAKRAKTKEKPYKLGDGGGPFLWVTPSGGKLWHWSYRHEGNLRSC
jgi:hypothetical protein